MGHYPWAVAISKTQARVLSVGLSNTGLFDWRPFRQGIDPVYTIDTGVTETAEGGLCYITWNLGTAVCFPFGLRPSFRALYGSGGTHHYGHNVLPVLDDFPVLYPKDASSSGLVPWVSGAPNGLVQFIQSGLGGGPSHTSQCRAAYVGAFPETRRRLCGRYCLSRTQLGSGVL